MYKLPVFETVVETYRFIGCQLSALLNYIIIPVFTAAAFSLFIFSGTKNTTGVPFDLSGVDIDPDQLANSPAAGIDIPLSIAFAIVNIAFYILFAVAWHRRYLLGPAVTSPREIFTWRGRHWRFFGNGILVGIVVLAAGLVIAFPIMAVLTPLISSLDFGTDQPSLLIVIGLVINVFVAMPVGLVLCRIVFVFPAAAIGVTGFGLG